MTQPSASVTPPRSRLLFQVWQAIQPYVSIARPDHWFKNAFILPGMLLALFYSADQFAGLNFLDLLFALLAACLTASSNYVLNEILDGPTDREHPVKRHRPMAAGKISRPLAYSEWLALAAAGLGLAWLVSVPLLLVVLSLWVMGLVYNVPPLRSKEHPYVDVLSESVNTPIRVLIGWFVVPTSVVPPVSLLVAFWMMGAFFMASKRFAEYRSIGGGEAAAAYRRSFRFYDDERLLVSMFFYAAAAALTLGVFIVRYKLELALTIPLIAGFFSHYIHVTLKPNSPVQNPERLYRETRLMAYLVVCVVAFFGLMFVEVPALYGLFNVTPAQVKVLWTF